MVSLPVPNQEQVEKFRQLYLKHFGVMLSDQDALREATNLVHLVFAVKCLRVIEKRAEKG